MSIELCAELIIFHLIFSSSGQMASFICEMAIVMDNIKIDNAQLNKCHNADDIALFVSNFVPLPHSLSRSLPCHYALLLFLPGFQPPHKYLPLYFCRMVLMLGLCRLNVKQRRVVYSIFAIVNMHESFARYEVK